MFICRRQQLSVTQLIRIIERIISCFWTLTNLADFAGVSSGAGAEVVIPLSRVVVHLHAVLTALTVRLVECPVLVLGLRAIEPRPWRLGRVTLQICARRQ